MSRKLFVSMAMSAALLAVSESINPKEPVMILHVSPTGNNASDGLTAETALASIQTAYEKVAQHYKSGLLENQATILVHAGDYVLARPLHFNGDFPVEIRAFENDAVTISGGKPLTGWSQAKLNGVKVWKTTLPAEITEVPFLYLDGKTATAARWPKKDYFHVTDERSGFTTDPRDCDTFHLNKGDFNPAWHDIQNISVKMLHLWVEEWLGIESYDDATSCVTTANSIRYMARSGNTEVAFYNVREALSEPGEYYFDRGTHELFLVTAKNAEPVDAVIPRIGTLARFDSDARWVTLRGLTFQYAGSHRPVYQDTYDSRDAGYAPIHNRSFGINPLYKKPFYSSGQGDCHVPGVLFFDHASDCFVKDCAIRCCAWYGVQIVTACKNLVFRGNELCELGAGGFLISGANYATVQADTSLQTSHVTIQKNHIHDCGQIFHAATGICLQHAWGCLLEENHIHDLYYSGISAGWVWGYAPSMTHDIRIHKNYIHDLGKGVLSDMGGVYMLGVQPGSRVWENVVHTVVNRYYGGWGLYTDEGSSHIVLEKNLVYDCACEGFHQHYGGENTIRYNVFAFNKKAGMVVGRDPLNGYACPGELHSAVTTFHDNVILVDGTPVMGSCADFSIYEKHKVICDVNTVYDISGKQDFPWGVRYIDNEFKPLDRKAWQALGLDRHSVIADPGFKNPKKRDFHLKKNSILRGTAFDFLEDILK